MSTNITAGGLCQETPQCKIVYDAGVGEFRIESPGRAPLRLACQAAVSPDGLNADGFKVDFTGDLPRGSGYRPVGDLWGLDLTHDYVKLIHDAMRNAKSDTVLETHCANPHFADVTEMLRLNDIFSMSTKNPNLNHALRLEVGAFELHGVSGVSQSDLRPDKIAMHISTNSNFWNECSNPGSA